MTSAERQKKFRESHSKLMIPNELKAMLDTKAKPLGITPAELLRRLLTQDQEPLGITLEDKVMHLVRDGHHGKTRQVIAIYGSSSAAYAAISAFQAYECSYKNRARCRTDIGRTLARLQHCVSATKPKHETT